MHIIILWAAKVIQFFSRKRGHGGAALPGLFVEKVSKDFLSHYLRRIPGGIVVVSGTNGKTTTTKLIVDSLELGGQKVFTNRSGSNMTRGLVSAVVSNSDIFGRLPYDIAVLEVDEAYSVKLSEKIPITGAVVLNVMRDQLDRFGEIDNTAKMLSALTSRAKDFVVLNASDKRVSGLPVNSGVKRITFGLGANVKKMVVSEDDWHKNQKSETSDKADALLISSKDNECSVSIASTKLNLKTKISGVHNHANITAAMVCLNQLGVHDSLKEIARSLESVSPAFGRGENIKVGNSNISIQLVKNPSSFEQTVKAAGVGDYDSVSIVINDDYADGRDVSWLWDVDFSEFKKAKKVLCSGTRAYDLAVRLRHEEVKPSDVIIDEFELADKVIKDDGANVIFCTYTAMLKLRKYLVSKGYAKKVL